MKTGPRTFPLTPQGPFSLDAARSLQCGFLLGTRACDATDGSVRLAFPCDGGAFQVVGVKLDVRDGGVQAEVS